MPSELRHLLFRPAEVVQAVKDYHRRCGKPLPAGTVLECMHEADEENGTVRFRMTVAPDQDGDAPPRGQATREVLVEGPTLAAALILHCHDRRIPLPAMANKSLQCFGDQVCLLVTINPRQEDLRQLRKMTL